jgi:hypothetical protein
MRGGRERRMEPSWRSQHRWGTEFYGCIPDESHQVRTFFGLRGLVGCAAGLWVSYLIGQKQPVPHGLTACVVLSALASTITIGIYDHQIKLFWG